MTAKSALLTLTPKDMPQTGSNGRSGEALPQRQADVERPVWAVWGRSHGTIDIGRTARMRRTCGAYERESGMMRALVICDKSTRFRSWCQRMCGRISNPHSAPDFIEVLCKPDSFYVTQYQGLSGCAVNRFVVVYSD